MHCCRPSSPRTCTAPMQPVCQLGSVQVHFKISGCLSLSCAQLPELASEMFAAIATNCCSGTRLVCTLSGCRLRDLLKRYGHAVHLIEDYEPAGVVLNRINCAGWSCDMILSGELESKYDVDLHNCLYIVYGKKL